MRFYLKHNVYEAAIQRLHRIFDEFGNVVVCTSGGKDSTVTMEMALKVAEERDRLPLKVLFVDQECEYQMVIDYMRVVREDPRVELIWLQMPLRITNSLSAEDDYMNAWHPDEEWMREKEPGTYQVNDFGVDEWNSGGNQIFEAVLKKLYPDEEACYLAGVRAEESPTRLAGLTTGQTYKEITWGKKLNVGRGHYTFYPIWDWSLSDVWKSIFDHGWSYSRIYDELYRYGIPPHRMRVSSLNHENAVHSLFFLQEVERDTWNALVKRVKGINQTAHMEKNEMMTVQELPFMFDSWKEYRDYLTDHLIPEEYRAKFHKRWAKHDKVYAEMVKPEDRYRAEIKSVLLNDHNFVKMGAWLNSPAVIAYRHWKQGRINERARDPGALKYIPKEALA